MVRRLLSDKITGHAILCGPLRGEQIVTSWHDYPGAILGTTERSLLRWFQSNVRHGETWLDVGAHYGYTAIALSRLVGREGRVFAFEPVRSTAAALARTRAVNALDQLAVVPFALCEQRSRRVLDVPRVRGMADSTLDASECFEMVSTISLDTYWPELAGVDAPIHGIKIDVQGMELAVLAGMRGLLAEWRPKLIVEFHRGVARGPVLELLSSTGYSTAIEPVDQGSPANELADDHSYFFRPKSTECAFSSTRSTTGRN
jgi:FkbM family methyltransferase